MKFIERLKLKYRAYRYKNKSDKGGINYLLSSIKEGQTVLDIGAHKAGYLYFMHKKTGKSGRIYAFEPQTRLHNYISGIKELFKWDNVIVEKMALSDIAGTTTLYIPVNDIRKGSSPGATIIQKADQSGIQETEQVNMDILDSYCQRHAIRPDFLKIDVEGNELKVMKGGIETIKKYMPKILVEIEARHTGKEKVFETFEFLQSLGYKGYFINGPHPVSLLDFTLEKYQDQNNMINYCNNFIFEPGI